MWSKYSMNKNCSININGNVTGIQIQQNTVNSTQNKNVNEAFDYDKVLKILDEINMYRDMFNRAYNEKKQRSKRYYRQILNKIV